MGRLSRTIAWLVPVAALLPYILGPLLIQFSFEAEVVRPLLERLIYFWLLFLTWSIALQVAFRWFLPTPGKTKPAARTASGLFERVEPKPKVRSVLQVAALVLSVCAFLVSLQFVQAKLENPPFALALFSVGIVALQRSYSARSQIIRAGIARAVSITGISYLSVLVMKPLLSWEPALVCAALGLLWAGRDLTQHLSETREHSPTQAEVANPRKLARYTLKSRAALMCFVLAPTLVASLCYLGILPTEFILVFGIFPLLLPLAERLRQSDLSGQDCEFIRIRGDMIFVAFAAILVAVNLLGHL